jgi:hypothetical protein
MFIEIHLKISHLFNCMDIKNERRVSAQNFSTSILLHVNQLYNPIYDPVPGPGSSKAVISQGNGVSQSVRHFLQILLQQPNNEKTQSKKKLEVFGLS